MQYYYSRKNPDRSGVMKIHADKCNDLPGVLSRIYLGIFANEKMAVQTAKEKFQLTKVQICSCCVEK